MIDQALKSILVKSINDFEEECEKVLHPETLKMVYELNQLAIDSESLYIMRERIRQMKLLLTKGKNK